jgi:hypothetical protein
MLATFTLLYYCTADVIVLFVHFLTFLHNFVIFTTATGPLSILPISTVAIVRLSLPIPFLR